MIFSAVNCRRLGVAHLIAALLLAPTALLANEGSLVNPAPVPCSLYSGSGWNRETVPAQAVNWIPLGVGEMTVVNVCPQAKYFPSGVILTPGATYQISASGHWRDGFLPPVGPRGWNGLLLMAANRIPWKPMFYLSGSIGRREKRLLALGDECTFRVPTNLAQDEERKLYLFANDINARFFYNNNSDTASSGPGPLRVSIRRND